MFDVSWSELLILGIVTLIFVGPKELPVFLRTFGKYAGMVRRQAAEFRAQFDEAMREAELTQLKTEMEGVRDEIASQVRDVERSASVVKDDIDREVQAAAKAAEIKTPATAAPAAIEAPAAEQPAEPAPVAAEKEG